MVVVTCPQCGWRLQIAGESVGTTIPCGKCGRDFVATGERPPEPAARQAPKFAPATIDPLEWRPPVRRQEGETDAELVRRKAAEIRLDSAAKQLLGFGRFTLFCSLLALTAGARILINEYLPDGPGPNGRDDRLKSAMVWIGLGSFYGTVSWLIVDGATKMKLRENYSASLLAAVLAALPCFNPCFVVGMPFGIYALIALRDPNVRKCFASPA